MKPRVRTGKKRSVSIAPSSTSVGATETISASVPTTLVRQVRERIGAREFSQFVTRSMERELIRQNRANFVADVERESGPLSPDEIEAARRLLRK
jgi:hypothetical protein